MIQTFITSFFKFKKHKERDILSFGVLLVIIFSYSLYNYHLKDIQQINTVLNNILQFSGIFSALLITFIISKIFQIRQEKLYRLNEVISLSNKLTDFRRICAILIEEYDFWDSTMRRKMSNKYKYLTYFHLYLDDERNSKTKMLSDEFIQEKDNSGASFFLAVRSLLLSHKKSLQFELYDEYDYNIVYPLKLIGKWIGASSANCFFYYLDHKWNSYRGDFNFDALSKRDQETIVSLSKKINPKKYETAKFDKNLLVDVGNDFESHLLPRLYELTYRNELGIPKTLIFLIRILIITMFFGVLIPLFLSSLKIDNFFITIVISDISITVLGLSILYFILNFKRILETEIKISRENI